MNYGVILWSDPDQGQAVIWCEDCGCLAYYQAPDRPDHARLGFFDTGDYVEFELTKHGGLRRASNAHKLHAAASPRVQETLQQGTPTEDARRRGRPIAALTHQPERPETHPWRGKEISRLG